MKHLYILLISFLVLLVHAQASPTFDSKSKYRLSCKIYENGVLALGSEHGSSAYYYYVTDTNECSDGWWYLTESTNGYYLQNAKTMEYVTYTGNRINQVAKGIEPTSWPKGSASEWTLVEDNGYWTIRNVQDPTQWFNLRRDGSYLLGSYEGSGADNELFKIYNDKGKEITNSGSTGGNFRAAADTIMLNNKVLVFDKTSQTYFASLPDSLQQGGTWKATFRYTLAEGQPADATIGISEAQTLSGDTIAITNPSCQTNYTLTLTIGGEQTATAKLRFTFLPIVDINLASCNGSYYTLGNIRVNDASNTNFDEQLNANFKYRGATAQSFPKKSYAIKICDADGQNLDHSFFSLRNDKSWILDAMYIDRACMRNRVGTDLWNDFSVRPYYADKEPEALTGTRGRFVEVFLNGTYHGLYCMTEKMDRKQLKLKKFKEAAKSDSGEDEIHGLLYKSSDWSYEVFMGHDTDRKYYPHHAPAGYTNTLGVETWRGFEIKYPDFEDEAVDWQPLYNAINFVATSSQSDFDKKVRTYFDYATLRDYYLFIELMLATDNHGKNMFYYIYDNAKSKYQKLGMAPWDLDGTFGQNYYAETSYTSDATQDFDSFLWQHEHGQLTLYTMLENSSLDWDEYLAQRYAELRTTYFSPESLANRFSTYASLFANSQADQREQTAWPRYHSALQDEATYAEEWVKERIATLDLKYGYDPTTTSINQAEANAYFSATGADHAIGITAGQPTLVRIYSISGALVRSVQVGQGFTPLTGFNAGAYIVNGHKVIVR